MKTWKLWIIASSSDDEGVSSQVVDFDSLEAAEGAREAVKAADEAEEDEATYTQLDAVRLYEAPPPDGWDKM